MTATPSPEETARQYRVARQMLAMHTDLQDRYARYALVIELGILVVSALIASTRFAGDEFFESLHLTAVTGRLTLGIAASLSFVGSLVLLLVNPRGKSATHAEAVRKLSEIVQRFRAARTTDDSWPASISGELAEAYGRVCSGVVAIPDSKFNNLKARYLRKVKISKLQDLYPGCPLPFLALVCRVRDSYHAVLGTKNEQHSDAKNAPRPSG